MNDSKSEVDSSKKHWKQKKKEKKKKIQTERVEAVATWKWEAFYIHGSKDSTDVDKIYVFPSPLPPHDFCLEFYNQGKQLGEDRNLVVMKEGFPCDCFKVFFFFSKTVDKF